MEQTTPAPAVKSVPSFWRRWTMRAAIALGALTIFGFFAAPPLVKHFVTKELSQALQRPVSFETVRINPFTLRAEVQGIAIGERGSADTSQPVLSVAGAVVNLEMESLFKRAPVVSEITLDQPRLKIVRTSATRINFSDLIDHALAAPPSPEPARFALFNITVRDGTIDVDDQTVKKQHKVSGIELGIPFISNLATYVDVNVEPRFAANINGSPLDLKGASKPFAETPEATLDLKLAAFPLAPWMAYLPQSVPVVLTDGRLQTNLTLVFTQPPKAAPKLLLRGTAQLNDVKASERSGAALGQAARVALILDSVEPLTGKIALKSLHVSAPQVAVTREANGVLNLQRLASVRASAATTTPTSSSPTTAVTLGELLVSDAQVDWRDEAVKPAFAGRAQFNKLEVRNFSSAGGTASFDVQGVALGSTLASSGEFSLGGNEGEMVSARGTASLTELALKQLAPYTSPLANLDIDSGTFSGKTRFNVSLARDLTLTLSETEGELANLKTRLRGEKEPLLSAQRLAAKGVELDLRQQKVNVADVTLGGVSSSASRGKDGVVNWQKLLPQPAKTTAPAKPWNVAVKQVSINQTSLRFSDDAVAPSVVSLLELQGSRISNFATAPGSKVELALKGTLNKTGRLGVGGTVGLQPLAANVRLDVSKLGIKPFEPYFADALNIKLQSADVNARGMLDVAQDAAGTLKAAYAGDLNLTDLQTQTIENAEDFLRWKSLSLSALKANAQLKAGGGVESWALDLGEVALADFYSRLIIYPSGRLNLQDIVKNGSGSAPSGTTAPKPSASAALAPAPVATSTSAGDTEAKLKEAQAAARNALTALPVKVGRISLTAGNVNFSDRFIKPNYSANLTNLGGSISALAADGTPANVDLRGTVDNTAPLQITGKLNPLGRDLFLDLKAAVSDVELPTLSPYAAKYAGYGIEKGKLAMDVSYLIEGGKLTAQNRVVLDQLTFGPKVESPDATKLPVLLAVALLTDSKGRIDINLPVTGSLNDPQFSVGGIIIQVIVNLIGKALTAPFALLGAAFGGGDELAFIEFAPGSSTLDASADKKLATLTKAMNDRPALRLDLAGRVDPSADREGARRSNLEAKLLAAHAKAGGSTMPTLAALPTPEREKLLKAVYDAADFPKPRNVIGLARSLPAGDMEKLLLTHTPVSDEDLRLLANARAQRVKDALSKGGIKPERLFLVANAAAPTAKAAPTRVDLALKQ